MTFKVTPELKRLYNNRYRDKNPEARLRNHLHEKYKLTIKDYEDMLKIQNNKCYCCKSESKLVVDHNHFTGKVRKLLCYRCNGIAGSIEDDKYTAVLDYLKEHNAESSD